MRPYQDERDLIMLMTMKQLPSHTSIRWGMHCWTTDMTSRLPEFISEKPPFRSHVIQGCRPRWVIMTWYGPVQVYKREGGGLRRHYLPWIGCSDVAKYLNIVFGKTCMYKNILYTLCTTIIVNELLRAHFGQMERWSPRLIKLFIGSQNVSLFSNSYL